jgi:hypothetical protein
MLLLWLFWLETMAFSGFMLCALLVQRPAQVPLTPYHKAALVVYGIALLSCLYGLLGFARRRLAQGKA